MVRTPKTKAKSPKSPSPKESTEKRLRRVPSRFDPTPTKSPRASSPSKQSPKNKHPPYLKMVEKAIAEEGSRAGASVQYITKYLESKYKLDSKSRTVRMWVHAALKRGLRNNLFTHNGSRTKGTYQIKHASEKKPKETTPKRKTAKSSPKLKLAMSAPSEKAPSTIADLDSTKTTSKKKRKSIEAKPSPSSTPLKKTPRKSLKSPESSPLRSSKKSSKEEVEKEDKEMEDVGNISPDITTTGVVFNTTDLHEVRLDVKTIIDALLTDDQVKVGVIANRGWKDTKYNLELLDFSDDSKKLDEFVGTKNFVGNFKENSFGEGAQWLDYYREVLQAALNFSWASHLTKVLVLIGNEGIGAVSGTALQAEVGRLSTLGVKVFAFHHSQLDLLKTVLKDLN